MVTTPQEYLAHKFPPLERYCPILGSLSVQQIVFLLDPSREALYGGAVGGGKSAALLAAALRYVDMPGYSALLLRRTFPELEKSGGLIPLADSWLMKTDARRAKGGKEWNFPSGARIEFGHAQHEQNKYQYQGAAYTAVGFDELTHFTESIYEYIGFSRQRRDFNLIAPIQTLATANPGGVGHLWVKKRFQLSESDRTGLPLFVPAKVKDNPAWRPGEYEASLSYLPDELRRQLLEGDWEAFADQAFPLFGDPHLVDGFPLGSAHLRFECADYGFNGCAWHMVAIDFDGNLIFCDSIYERDKLPSEIAPMVLKKRKGYWGRGNRVEMDPTIWRRTGGLNQWGQPATIATEFEEHGVKLNPGNNDPRAGYTRLRELVEPDPEHPFPEWHRQRGEKGSPRLFVVASRCPDLRDQLGAAPLQPIDKADGGEKIDPIWEGQHGHAVAAARYGAISWGSREPSERPKKLPDDPRIIALLKYEKKLEEQAGTSRLVQI
jgi:hypothetical protein